MCIYNLIESIRKRPCTYLGSNSITALMHFLNGYQAAHREMKNSQITNRSLFPLDLSFMNEFAQIKLNCSNKLGWCHILLNENGGNEEAALHAFFELYDEFCQIQMKHYWKTTLSHDNIAWNNAAQHAYRIVDGERTPIFSSPECVYVLELSIPAYMLIVECADDVKIYREMFSSLESARGKNVIPFGAEIYFGKIDSWEEPSNNTLEFGLKPLNFC